MGVLGGKAPLPVPAGADARLSGRHTDDEDVLVGEGRSAGVDDIDNREGMVGG